MAKPSCLDLTLPLFWFCSDLGVLIPNIVLESELQVLDIVSNFGNLYPLVLKCSCVLTSQGNSISSGGC